MRLCVSKVTCTTKQYGVTVLDRIESNQLVSIIVPIYQVEKYLDKCISSITNQTYKQLEIILVDDGSPDNCPAMCDSWGEKDSRIHVIHKENGGLSDARNTGLSLATGEYICFVDSDDYIEPTYIEEMFLAMQHTGADIVECGVQYVDITGVKMRVQTVTTELVLDRLNALTKLILEDGVYQTVWNKLYRREVIGTILFDVGRYHEDDFWTYQIIDRVSKMTILTKPLYNYLQRSTSIMGNGYTLKRLDGLEARYRRMQYFQKYDNLATLTRQQLLSDCLWHYQCALSSLNGSDKDIALRYILQIKEKTPNIRWNQLIGKLRHRIWIMLFAIAPNFTAKARNKLGVGL